MSSLIKRQFVPRDYQHAAVNYLWQAFAEHSKHIDPLIVMPTGTGKASLLGMIIKDIYANWPKTGRVIVLTHVKELVEQDAAAIKWVWPGVSRSIYSSGLNSKDISGRVIIAGIQSFVNIAHEIDNPSVVLIDEAHMIPMSSETTYRKTLDILREKNPKLVCIGLTATPYRLKGGHLLDCGLFNHIACDFGSREKFLRFIQEGYLARLITKPTETAFDLSEVGEVAGEYNLAQMSAAVDKMSVTEACCREMLLKGHDRKKWLIFASSIEHAEHISECLNDMGVRTDVVHSKMSKSRDAVIKEFKTGNLRALVNMGVLTTGFDFPHIDLIGMMRPTKSVSLHIQMLGRGTRPVYADGFDLSTKEGRLAAIMAGAKANGCLVFDFARNIENLGPINDPVLPKKKKKNGAGGFQPGDVPVKVCPACLSYCATRANTCEDCGHEFPPPTLDLTRTASDEAAIAGLDGGKVDELVIEDIEVEMVNYSLYQKPGKPPSIRAVYACGMLHYSSWLCFQHKGSAQKMARDWWIKNTGNTRVPETCEEFLGRRSELTKPVKLRVWVKTKGFPEILTVLYQEDLAA